MYVGTSLSFYTKCIHCKIYVFFHSNIRDIKSKVYEDSHHIVILWLYRQSKSHIDYYFYQRQIYVSQGNL